MTLKIKDPSEYFTDEDNAHRKRKEELEAASRRIDEEYASMMLAQTKNETIDQERQVNALIEGTTIEPPVSYAVRLNELRQQKWNIERALDVLASKEYDALFKAKQRLCSDLKPLSDAMDKQLAEAMATVHKIHSEYFRIRRDLIGNGIGLHGGVFSADLESFLGIPSRKESAIGAYLSDAVRQGYLKRLPENLR